MESAGLVRCSRCINRLGTAVCRQQAAWHKTGRSGKEAVYKPEASPDMFYTEQSGRHGLANLSSRRSYDDSVSYSTSCPPGSHQSAYDSGTEESTA
jgi:hypothetical protein